MALARFKELAKEAMVIHDANLQQEKQKYEQIIQRVGALRETIQDFTQTIDQLPPAWTIILNGHKALTLNFSVDWANVPAAVRQFLSGENDKPLDMDGEAFGVYAMKNIDGSDLISICRYETETGSDTVNREYFVRVERDHVVTVSPWVRAAGEISESDEYDEARAFATELKSLHSTMSPEEDLNFALCLTEFIIDQAGRALAGKNLGIALQNKK
jgi:hypothetical protein